MSFRKRISKRRLKAKLSLSKWVRLIDLMFHDMDSEESLPAERAEYKYNDGSEVYSNDYVRLRHEDC